MTKDDQAKVKEVIKKICDLLDFCEESNISFFGIFFDKKGASSFGFGCKGCTKEAIIKYLKLNGHTMHHETETVH
jgi:hypothetical protein